MAHFTIMLSGQVGDGDEVRELFEVAVRAARAAIEGDDGPFGSLILDGASYPVDNVTDEPAAADTTDEEEETEEAQS